MNSGSNPLGGQNLTKQVIFKDLVKFIDLPFPNVDYEFLPKNMRNCVDNLAKELLRKEQGRVVVIGAPFVGKTSIVKHFAKNIDLYLPSTPLNNLYILNLSRIQDMQLSETNGLRTFLDSICLSLHCDLQEICLYTESIDFAGYVHASNIPVKIILEINMPTYIKMVENENQGLSKVWGTYENVNADFALPTLKELERNLNILKDEISINIDSDIPEDSVSRFLRSFINKIPDKIVYQLLDDEDDDEDSETILNIREKFDNCVKIPIGLWSKAFNDTITHYTFSQEKYDNEDDRFDEALQVSFEKNLIPFVEAIENFDSDGESVLAQVLGSSEEHSVHVIQMGMVGDDDEDEDDDTEIDTTPFKFSEISSLSKRLKKSIIGQNEAVENVAESFAVPAVGINDPLRPIRSFLFLGPTGVGKTQLAKSLAEEVSDDELNVIRLDMSEYSQSHEAVKLLGSPAGYVGYQDGGILTKQVQKHPKSLIILDEVEKAHPKTWDTFLQILDAGRLTDNHGKVVDFTKTIIVLTSNLGAKEGAQESFGFFNESTSKSRIMRKVEEFFKPEFINRIDDIVVFHPLSIESAKEIVKREIGIVSHRLKNKGLKIKSVSDSLIDFIIKDSGFQKYGARDIQRAVFRNISQPLAKAILKKNSRKKTFELGLKQDNQVSII